MGNKRSRRSKRRRLTLQVLDERRVLAAITGLVYEDVDDSLHRDVGEIGLAKRVVFLDADQNGQLGNGEAWAITGEDGSYQFDGLNPGTHHVTLFNGTASQVQTSPTSATATGFSVSRADTIDFLPSQQVEGSQGDPVDLPAVIASGTLLETLDSSGQSTAVLDLQRPILSLQRIAGGDIVVMLSDDDGTIGHLISPTLTTLLPFSGDATADSLTASALDDVGRGVVVTQGSEESGVVLASVDASSQTVANQPDSLPFGTLVIGDEVPRVTDGPTRSILAAPTTVDDGEGGSIDAMAMSIWSNNDESFGDGQPVNVPDVDELVTFSDEAGLLVTRGDGELTVRDVDNQFAELFTLADTGNEVAIDVTRGLMVTLSPVDSAIRLIDVDDGSLVADLAVDLASLGAINRFDLDPQLARVIVVGAAGIAEFNLRNPRAHTVTLDGSGDQTDVDFGVRMIAPNVAPAYGQVPQFEGVEDTVLSVPAPDALADASDADGDTFVFLKVGEPNFGVATTTISGGLTYTPADDFNGVDVIGVVIADGADLTEADLSLTIEATPDPPTGVSVTIDPVPEDILPNTVIGVIDIIDGDVLDNHIVEVDDTRFIVVNGEIIYLGEGLNWEDEIQVALDFTVSDPDFEGQSLTHSSTFTVLDRDDPITDIFLSSDFVFENAPGDVVGELSVDDEDFEQLHDFAVDDSRFTVEFGELRLVDGVAIDFEAEENGEIVINITASHGDDSFTKEFVIRIGDSVEQPANLQITNGSVTEFVIADVVGDLTVGGNPAANGHTLEVNDSRFVIEGSTLRLADGVFVDKAEQDFISLEITATTIAGNATETFDLEVEVLANGTPFHNDDEPFDVNVDDDVTALDVLTVINHINTHGPEAIGDGNPLFGYDVNNDGKVTALDALLIINHLNSGASTGTVGSESSGGEPASGEPVPERSQHLVENREAEGEALTPPSTEILVDADIAAPRDSRPTDVARRRPVDDSGPRSHSIDRVLSEWKVVADAGDFPADAVESPTPMTPDGVEEASSLVDGMIRNDSDRESQA
ncbi:MAG: dockerin type I domain-containing protein [Planctomycetota bacterium]